MGATGDETLHELEIPGRYGADRFAEGPVAECGDRLSQARSPISRMATHTSPDFDDAVALHRLIDADRDQRRQAAQALKEEKMKAVIMSGPWRLTYRN